MFSIEIPNSFKERIRHNLAKYANILQKAKEHHLNEADTSEIVSDIISDILGFDKYFDVINEYPIDGHYADFAIKLKEKLVMLVEIKAIATQLSERHLFQVTTYAVNEGVEWVILTNGGIWQLYHVAFTEAIEKELVAEIDFLSKQAAPGEKSFSLFLLSKESLSKGNLKQYWQEKVALSPENVARALLSETVLNKLSERLKDMTNYEISTHDLQDILERNVLRLNMIPTKPPERVAPKRKVKERKPKSKEEKPGKAA